MSTYTKGGVTYKRSKSGELSRVDKPKKKIVVAYKRDRKSGKVRNVLKDAPKEVKQTIADRTEAEGKQVVSVTKTPSKTTYNIQSKATTQRLSQSVPLRNNGNTAKNLAVGGGKNNERVSNRVLDGNNTNASNYDRFNMARSIAVQMANQKNQTPTMVSSIEADKTELTFSQRMGKKSSMARYAATQEGNFATWRGVKESGKSFVYGAVEGAASMVELGKNLVTKPKATTKAIGGSVKRFAKDPQGSIQRGVYQFSQEPERAFGRFVGSLGVSKGVGAVGKVAKNTYIRTGATYVPEEQVFAKSVLQGKEKLPTSKSTAESIQRFRDADNIVQTSAPAKISGKEAGVGKKASTGFEDPGIYVTPKGEGSPYFLGISKDSFPSYSWNPLKGGFRKIPTVTEFKAKAVKRLPRKVTNKPGFKAVKEFHESQAGSGDVYITKRSEIGQGTIKPRYNPQTKKLEAGTVELEAVVPYKQGFSYTPKTLFGKIKGFEEYTRFEGELVAIRKAELVNNKGLKVASLETPSKFLSGKTIQSESYSLSRLKDNVKSPYPSVYAASSSLSTPSVSYGVLPSSSFPVTGFVSSVKPVVSSSKPVSASVSSTSLSYSTSSVPESSSYLFKQPRRSRGSGRSSSSKPSFTPSSIVSRPISRPGRSTYYSNPSYSSSSRGSSSSSYARGSSYSYSPFAPITGSTVKSSFRKNNRGSSSFDVYVRRRGVFEKIGSRKSIGEAFGFGKRRVGTTAAASFKITRAGSKQGIKYNTPFVGNFYSSQREKGVFVEKLGKRITSGGELKEITFKGIAASKGKKKKKKKDLWRF